MASAARKEHLEADKAGEIVNGNVVGEFGDKLTTDAGEVGQRAVLELVGTEGTVTGHSEYVPMNRRRVNLVDVGDPGPANVGVLEVRSDHDGILGDLEMAMDQVDSERLLSPVSDKESGVVPHMVVYDVGLGGIIQETVVPGNIPE